MYHTIFKRAISTVFICLFTLSAIMFSACGNNTQERESSTQEISTTENVEADDTDTSTICPHNWIEISDTTTCTTDGIKTFECLFCGQLYELKQEAYGHTTVETETVHPCTTDGKKIIQCTTCGEILETITLPKEGHNYSGLVCKRCGYQPIAFKHGNLSYDGYGIRFAEEAASPYESDGKTFINMRIKNLTSKTITSAEFTIYFYDKSRQPVTEKYSGLSYKVLTLEKTIASGQSDAFTTGDSWMTLGYYVGLCYTYIDYITLTFSDGTTEVVADKTYHSIDTYD